MDKIYRLGIYEKAMPNSLSFKEKLETATKFGYDFMEMSIDETPEKLARLDMSPAARTELLNTMRETGIPIRSICLSGHRKYPLGSTDSEALSRSIQIMEKAIRLADDLGIRLIQLAGYDTYYDISTNKTRAQFLESLNYSVNYAARYGVILAFETMETPFMDNVKKAMEYVNKIDSPYLQAYPDIGNCTNAALKYNEDVLEDLKAGKGHIVAMHLKETVPGRFRDIKFGTGHVNFAAAISLAIAQGVRIFVTEFWDSPDIGYLEHIKLSKNFIDYEFEKALW